MISVPHPRSCLPVPLCSAAPPPRHINPTIIILLPTHSFKLYLHLYHGFCFCFSLRLFLLVLVPNCRFLCSPHLPLLLLFLTGFYILRFLRSARIWVNRCSVVSIFYRIFRFMTHTLALPPSSPACTCVQLFAHIFSSSSRFLLQRTLRADCHISDITCRIYTSDLS
jgi:hypothetical protein